MNFGSPFMFLLVLPVAIAAWRLFRRGRNRGIKFSAFQRIPEGSSAGWRAFLSSLSPYVLLLSLLMLVIASARPRTALSRQTKSIDAIAIAMTMDVSGSMLALDFAPKECFEGRRSFTIEMSRLAMVKKIFADFVRKRPDDLIGLVAFGGYASTRVPLTLDHEALLKVLSAIDVPTGSGEQMTAIGDGLAVALARLKDSTLQSKIVILLSDGVSNVGAVQPEQAAAAAAELGIKVYTIGVGTASHHSPFLVKDIFGSERVMYQNTSFDEAQLKSIAEKTGGVYFDVNDRNALEEALREIDKLEKTKIDSDVYDRWNEYFAIFLLIGAILLVLAVSMSMASTRRLA